MNYAEIKYCDIANGEGVRVSLFVSGCTHRCKNCFNRIAWDFNYGNEFTDDVAQTILDACAPEYISGITLLGGEPFEPENQPTLIKLLDAFRIRYPDKNVWCYSGYTYEEITGKKESRCFTDKTIEMLNKINILVDGEYVEDLHSLMLKFKGSSNQRLIDVAKSREQGRVVIIEY